jgi:hypothetical protein
MWAAAMRSLRHALAFDLRQNKRTGSSAVREGKKAIGSGFGIKSRHHANAGGKRTF